MNTNHIRSRAIRSIIGLLFLAATLVPATQFTHASTIDDLNNQIDQKRQAVKDQNDKISQYEQQIKDKEQQANTLSNELDIISVSIDKTKAEIDENQKETDLTKSEITKTELEIKSKEDDIAKQKDLLKSFIIELDRRDRQHPLMIWLQNSSFSQFLDQAQYLETLQSESEKTLNNIQKIKQDLEWDRESLKGKKEKLESLKSELIAKNRDLQAEQDGKESLLNQTKQEESSYQDLLKQAKDDQTKANSDVASLEQQLRELESNNQGDDNLNKVDPNKNAIFMWPVPPLRGISTHFHDPTYPFRFIIGEHNAIDIPTPQGTPLKAAASGYVAKAYFPGTLAYSYIFILHDGGYSTLYGHVSGIAVHAGQYVNQGQVIGYSGGARGSIGSGGYTTGAHLHFEVKHNGVFIDPESVLP